MFGSFLVLLGAGVVLFGILLVIFSTDPYPANTSHGGLLAGGLLVVALGLISVGLGVLELGICRRAYIARNPNRVRRRPNPRRVNQATIAILWAIVLALMLVGLIRSL